MAKVGAAGLSDAGDDLLREAHAVGEIAAPGIRPVVGSAHQELVDQVAFGAHDLDAIVASFTRQHGAADVGADGPFHAPSTERPRAELADGRLALGGRDAERMVAVAPAVQNLQGNAAIGCVHSIGHLPVLGALAGTHKGCSMGSELACAVGADAACDDEPSATLGPLGIELRELGEAALFFLEPHVHGAHDGAVGHGHACHLQRLQQMGVLRMAWSGSGHDPKFGQSGQSQTTVCIHSEYTSEVHQMRATFKAHKPGQTPPITGGCLPRQQTRWH